MTNFVHPTAVIDDGAQIGKGTKVWHFVHISGARIGNQVSIGQNVFIGNKVNIGNNCKIQNNVSFMTMFLLKTTFFVALAWFLLTFTIRDRLLKGSLNIEILKLKKEQH